MTWFVKTYYVELDLGERLELGRKNWETAHGERGERVVPLASRTRHIGERCVSTLVGALESDIFLADRELLLPYLLACSSVCSWP